MQSKHHGRRIARHALICLPGPRVTLASLVVLGAGALSACGEKPKPPKATPTVAARAAVKGPLPYVIVANGVVEPNRTVAVQSLVSGMLTHVAIAEGDEVKQGQVIFEIDPRPFRAEIARLQGILERDQSAAARARTDSSRFAALAKDGYVTRQQLDQAFADVSAFSATVAADKASLEKARLDLENSTVRAQISGRTGQLAMKAGNLVRAQADPPLVIINELKPVLVRFSIPETDFEEMRRRAGLDRPLSVRIRPKVGDSTQVITGTLAFIDNVVDKTTGSVLLKARVANEKSTLWPGQFVTIGLELSVDSSAVTISPEAVMTTSVGTFVYIVNDGKAKRVAVKVGRLAGNVLKVDTGLVGGEQVIVEGQNRLSDGAKVDVRKPVAPPAGVAKEKAAPTKTDSSAAGGATR
jgi:multidrug efflux system membrane fusion protein